jgi:hypothetical protein
MNLKNQIEKVKKIPGCTVLNSDGIPELNLKHELPKDLRDFYELCGGMILFKDSAFSIEIVQPNNFVLANPVLINQTIIEVEIAKGTYEKRISNDWYIIADLNDSNYIVIDLNKKRLGRCYRAFWETYPHRGDTPIIAKSFTELLECLIQNNGDFWYFEKANFIQIGDAYDEIEES